MGFNVFDPGEIVTFPDNRIAFYPQLSSGRQIKKHRFALILMEQLAATDADWPVVMACPIHSDYAAITDYDVLIPKGTVRTLDTDSWVVVPSLQPMQKADVEGTHGLLPPDILLQVYQRVAQYTGIFEFLRTLNP